MDIPIKNGDFPLLCYFTRGYHQLLLVENLRFLPVDQKPSFTRAYFCLDHVVLICGNFTFFWGHSNMPLVSISGHDILVLDALVIVAMTSPHTACDLLMSFCPTCYTQTRETCALQNWNSPVDLSNSPADVAEDTTFSNSCCAHQICSSLKQVVKSPSKRLRHGKNGLCFTVKKRALQVVDMLVRDIRRFHINLFLGNFVGWY